MSYHRLIVFVNDVRIGIYDMDKLNLLKRKEVLIKKGKLSIHENFDRGLDKIIKMY